MPKNFKSGLIIRESSLKATLPARKFGGIASTSRLNGTAS